MVIKCMDIEKKNALLYLSSAFAVTDSVTSPSQLHSQSLHFLIYKMGTIIVST